MAAPVTPCRHGTGPTVLDECRYGTWCSAASLVGDALGITDQQGAYPVLHRKRHGLLGRLVMGLVDTAVVTGLSPALLMTMAAPAKRPSLPRPWHTSRRPDLACLSIAQVQVALRANGAARDE